MTVTLHIATIVTQANVVIAEVLVTTHFTITIIIISIITCINTNRSSTRVDCDNAFIRSLIGNIKRVNNG